MPICKPLKLKKQEKCPKSWVFLQFSSNDSRTVDRRLFCWSHLSQKYFCIFLSLFGTKKKSFWQKKNVKKLFFPFFKVFCMFKRLIQSQNDFSFVPNRHKKMLKTFSKKMGATRTFYAWRFFSYSKKTKNSFFSHFPRFFCFKGKSIAKMIIP